ncbi:uncharacterized protein LOC123296618 [Chrysoperla carnea]|uniref:uncharacterized protein LOC123296618 n=1 Tax=Chrysoperla carnea TaxID=189513 RepID=UPI001D084E80|nr:uncharacterized protein LOC123296618 [Chrysoperla carnea]
MKCILKFIIFHFIFVTMIQRSLSERIYDPYRTWKLEANDNNGHRNRDDNETDNGELLIENENKQVNSVFKKPDVSDLLGENGSGVQDTKEASLVTKVCTDENRIDHQIGESWSSDEKCEKYKCVNVQISPPGRMLTMAITQTTSCMDLDKYPMKPNCFKQEKVKGSFPQCCSIIVCYDIDGSEISMHTYLNMHVAKMDKMARRLLEPFKSGYRRNIF